jgi:hypothetical protein
MKLEVLLSEFPNHRYKKLGQFYYSNVHGFMSVFEHNPKDNQGFAGRAFTLTMLNGEQKTFKGTLWDPWKVPKEIDFQKISITTEKEVWERGFTFYSGKVDLLTYDYLINLVNNKK